MNADYKRLNLTGTRTRTVSGNVRMRIGLAGFTVSGPSCVTYTACADKRLAVIGLLGKILKSTDGLNDFRFFVAVSYGDTRRVISSVLKFCKTRQQYGGCLFVTDISDYTAHMYLFPA